MCTVYGGKSLGIKRFTTGQEILSRMLKSHRWCITTSLCWHSDRSNCAVGGTVDLSSQENNDWQRSNCTRVLPWFSIQHNAWSLKVSESVWTMDAQRTEGMSRNEPNASVFATSLMVCRWRREYAYQDCHWGRITGASLPTWIKACFIKMQRKHRSSPSTKKFEL
jgi:hypothetical protein